MIEEIQPILLAIAAAVIYAVGGYLKQSDNFDKEKFAITIAIGVVIGVISYNMGITYDAATQLLVSTGAIVIIEVYAKTIYRRLEAWFNENFPEIQLSTT